jgi:hypothetical protein
MLGLALWGIVINLQEQDYSTACWIMAYMIAVCAWWRTDVWAREAIDMVKEVLDMLDEAREK